MGIQCIPMNTLWARPCPGSCSVEVSGGRSLRSYYSDIVAMQGVAPNLPPACTARLDATSVTC